MLADQLHEVTVRTFALSKLLADRGVVGHDELEQLIASMKEEAELAVEFSDKPDHVAWRKLRRKIQAMEEGGDPNIDEEEGS